MGDHRASIKIEFEFHGVKDKTDMWINYWPEECCNMDKRVSEFFNKVYEKGMRKYEDQMAKYYEEKHKTEIEEREKMELKRLKQKYEIASPKP